MKNRNPMHDNWETPKDLYDKLDAEFHFDFDPCPLNSTFDGLNPDTKWGSSNFINPPYSRKLKEAFIKRAYEETIIGNMSVMLLPVSTSTKVFHKYIKPFAKIRFLEGRVKFKGINSKGIEVNNKCGQHDSMIVIFK